MRTFTIIALLACGLAVHAADAIKAADLPATVKTAMDKATKGAELTSVEKSTADGKTVYVGKYANKKGKEQSVTVGEDGTVIGGEGGKKKKK